MEKILVLADNHATLGFGKAADVGVRRFAQADVENVLTIQAASSKMLCERKGKLVIDEKIHEDWRTA